MYRLAILFSLLVISSAEASAPPLPEIIRYNAQASAEWQIIESQLGSPCSPEIKLLASETIVAQTKGSSCELWVSRELDNAPAQIKCEVLVAVNPFLDQDKDFTKETIAENTLCQDYDSVLPNLSKNRARKLIKKAKHRPANHCAQIEQNIVQCRVGKKKVTVTMQSSGIQIV